MKTQPKFKNAMSPLALLFIAACGGGGGGATAPTPSSTQNNGNSSSGGNDSNSNNNATNGQSSSSLTVIGNVVKGPLSNALVGLDYDGDGNIDSETVRTGNDGSFSITATSDNYTIVAVTDETTIDTSSGTVLDGVVLKAPANASVVSPTTTLIEETGLSKEDVAEVLGLPEGIDPLTFNAYAAGVDATDALEFEKISQKVMSVAGAFAAAAEGSGATEADAFDAAFESIVEVVRSKASQLDDQSALDSEKRLDFSSATDLALLSSEVATLVSENTDADITAFAALATDTASAVANVVASIDDVATLSSEDAANIFSLTQVLTDQVKSAAEAEIENAGSGSIGFSDATEVERSTSNRAPSNITLSNNEISEGASSLIVGRLSTTDSDQSVGATFKYEIAEVSGTDFEAFSINQLSGELSLLNQPNYTNKPSYTVLITSTDEGGKTFSKSFSISVIEADADGSQSNTDDSSDQSDGDAGSSGSDNSSGTNNSSNAFPTFTPGLDETAQDFEAPVLEAASVRDDTLDVGQTLFIDYTATDATGVDFVSFTFRDANRTLPRTLTASMKNIGLLMLTMMALLSFK